MGGRFRSLDHTHSECGWNLEEILLLVQILSPNSIEDQKKNPKWSSTKIKGILPHTSSEDQKKKLIDT